MTYIESGISGVMSSTSSEGLFVDGEGEPLKFSVRGPERYYTPTIDKIKKGGGVVLMRRHGPHTIVLDHPTSLINSTDQYYSSEYVSDCCEANALLDLNKYRLNKDSKYVKDFDSNLILLKKKSWNEIPLASERQHKDSGGSVDFDNSGEAGNSSLTQHSSNIKTGARPYSNAERLAIINIIIKKKAYSLVGGNALWMDLEAEEQFLLTSIVNTAFYANEFTRLLKEFHTKKTNVQHTMSILKVI